jgi:hypothetical protein
MQSNHKKPDQRNQRYGQHEMRNSKAVPATEAANQAATQAATPAARASLKPARVADSQLDHLEHMIVSFAKSSESAPLGCLDKSYWKRRLSALSVESDLVSVQRARILRLLDLLEQGDPTSSRDQRAA